MRGAVTTRRFTSASCIALTVVAGLTLGSGVRAEEQNSPGYFRLDRLDAYLELETQLDYDRVTSTTRGFPRRDRSQTNRDWGFVERVGFQIGGSLVDPSFINFGGDLSFALTQDHYREWDGFSTRSDTDHSHLLQYDLRLNFFEGKALSGSVYGLRQDDRISRRFQPTLKERRTGFGTSWYFADDVLPMELSYDYLETERDGNRDERDDERFIESTLHYGVDWNISDHHRFKLSYEHAKNKQEYQGLRQTFDTTRDLFTLEHELEFGTDHQHNLRTLVHWQEESGDFARDLFEIGPQLTLQHTDNLRTFYRYQFNRERYEGLDIETQRADFQLVHQLYSNLTTTVDLFGLYEDVEDDVNTTQYGAAVDWQYNRRNRFGHLYANLALGYDTEHFRGDDGRRVVLNEAITFRDPVTARLRNYDVLPGSIVVTDAANRVIYRPGLDYVAIRQGRVTRLTRIQTGRIADGDTVLVDYLYEIPTDGQLDTIRVDFNLEQRFSNGITPYYRFSYRNQEDDYSTGFARRADRTDHHRIGVNYETKQFTLGAEYEIFDDTVEPYDAFHVNGLWRVLQSPDHSLNTSARFSRLFFEGGYDSRNVNLLDAEVDHRWRLTETLSTVERLAYRWEDDSVDGITHGWDVSAGLEYVVGELSCELTFEYDRLALPGSDEEGYGLYVAVRREFPNVLGGS